ncbi:uncharacterized protein LW93_4315 [Fusarium fujikuroi]|nr:uncharacterized protein LW93_4315 [Fusarium fujikuroi]
MSTDEWLDRVMLIEQAVAKCRGDVAHAQSAQNEEELRAVITTMCHDIIGIIGRPQVERSLQAWSEVYPEQEGSKLIEKTSIYRHLQQKNTPWIPASEQDEIRTESQAASLRPTPGTSSSPPSVQEMDIQNRAERLRDALCLPPIRRASADNINLSHPRYISHLPPSHQRTPQDGYYSPFTTSPTTRSNRSESPRVLPPIISFGDDIAESPVFHTPQSSRRASQVSYPASDKSIDPFQPIHYDPNPHEKAAPSLKSHPTNNMTTHGDVDQNNGTCRIPSDKKAGTTFHEIPTSLAEYLERILAAGDMPFTLAGFRDRDNFYNCPFCSENGKRNYKRSGPFADHLVRHWKSLQT